MDGDGICSRRHRWLFADRGAAAFSGRVHSARRQTQDNSVIVDRPAGGEMDVLERVNAAKTPRRFRQRCWWIMRAYTNWRGWNSFIVGVLL